ncbi:CG10909 [Drosophila busckii]|uniref:rRNA 2'-O-methyltransferase fibrillarin n=1 Tax=Drosophila busckii TaxID=30019 RepID=A0A0M5IZL3_DROBS|nr:rRNA 2'-O-methyltransferase fibrillarin [Drosophila busckii]ALC45924.1 CG10909 [Drosophila busckii]
MGNISKNKSRARGDIKSVAATPSASSVGSDDSSVNSVGSYKKRRASIKIEPLNNANIGVYMAWSKLSDKQLVTQTTTTHIQDDDDAAAAAADSFFANFNSKRCKFRCWSPYQSKLAAALLKGVANVQLSTGTKVIYLGNTLACPVSHIADVVGETGQVYAIETSPWANRELLALASRRPNVVAITEEPTMPYKYRQLVLGSVDFIFCDMLHCEQLRILILHARHFLKTGGHFAIVVQGMPQQLDCFNAVNRLKSEQLQTLEQISLQPYVHGQVMLVGVYKRVAK